MKCPRCWTDKAYLRPVDGWLRIVLACLLLRPMKCHHCYHKFLAWWLATLGQQIHPPVVRVNPNRGPARPSYAAQHRAASERRRAARGGSEGARGDSKAA